MLLIGEHPELATQLLVSLNTILCRSPPPTAGIALPSSPHPSLGDPMARVPSSIYYLVSTFTSSAALNAARIRIRAWCYWSVLYLAEHAWPIRILDPRHPCPAVEEPAVAALITLATFWNGRLLLCTCKLPRSAVHLGCAVCYKGDMISTQWRTTLYYCF
jgi:hypothetical protein